MADIIGIGPILDCCPITPTLPHLGATFAAGLLLAGRSLRIAQATHAPLQVEVAGRLADGIWESSC